MNGSWTRTARPGFRPLLAVLVFHGCGPALPTALEERQRQPRFELALDTLDIEVQSLWIRISAVPPVREDLVLTWELEAETANPFWWPSVISKAGGRSFESPDTARVWGNIARAYDFRLVVSGLTTSGDFVMDTLSVEAAPCLNPARPTLLCNPGHKRTSRLRIAELP